MVAQRRERHYRQQQAQRCQQAQLRDPCTARAAQPGQRQHQRPYAEEAAQFPQQPVLQRHRQQAVGPEVADARHGQAGQRRYVQAFEQPVHARRGAAEFIAQLGAPLHHEQHGAPTEWPARQSAPCAGRSSPGAPARACRH
ncbi:hypothetical protein G6F22_020270 [Rhizopus arrhizus]|nr:hypothetical protein G6F22_020270 [Rhizopus arrhizus]